MKAVAAQAHTPVQPGTFSDRTRHEADRRAKWGTSRAGMSDPPEKVHRIADPSLVPPAQTKLVRCSSENTANDRRAAYAIDGDPRTVWHSQFTGNLASHPHELVIDLGDSYEVRGIRYLARQDSGWNGAFAKTEIYVSDSADDFGDPQLTTTFEKRKTPQSADFPVTARGRYVRIRILSEVNGNPWASAAEIGVVGAR
jgi:hypothetical protein